MITMIIAITIVIHSIDFDIFSCPLGFIAISEVDKK